MLRKSLRVPVGKFPRSAKVTSRGKFFIMKTFPNSLTYSRVGVVIGKGVVKGAVERNKIKREVFDVFERVPLLASPGVDYLVVVTGNDELDSEAREELTKGLEDAISKLD